MSYLGSKLCFHVNVYYRKTLAWTRHCDVCVYTVNTPLSQVRDTAVVRVGPIEDGKYVFLLLVPYRFLWCKYGRAWCVMRCKHGCLDPVVFHIHAGVFLCILLLYTRQSSKPVYLLGYFRGTGVHHDHLPIWGVINVQIRCFGIG